ncbi:NUDIX domain-containing protein [Streptomyces sp. NPDC048518]|uniref:NUDIX hydrolase n=1 Tax=Streptomyces sp. NPDC048518 TaxID=3155029 RepID=UPI00340728BC
MTDSVRPPSPLIVDVAQVLLRHNGAALCVRRTSYAGPASGQLSVLGCHLRAGESLDHAARRTAEEEADCHPHTAHNFRMHTHGLSYRAPNWPAEGGSVA